jgi:hypothetical protein
MALNFSLSISFDNMCYWKGIWEKAREINSMKVVIKMLRHLIEFSMAVTLFMIK